MVALGHSAAIRHRTEEALPPARRLTEPPAILPLPIPPRREAGHAALARAIEAAVLPRLALAHGTVPAPAELDALFGAAPTTEEVEGLLALLLVDDRAGAEAHVDAVMERGVTLERVFLELLAPAARRLGDTWTADGCDFGTVTIGLMRLQRMVRDRMPEALPPLRPLAGPRRILLANAPGEQHTFGRDMLAGFFRQAGWTVWDPAPDGAAEFAALVRRECFEAVGLSAGSAARLDAISECVRTVRRSAVNGGVGIMVGGPLFIAHPEYVALVGADATAADGRQAVLQAERLLAVMSRRD